VRKRSRDSSNSLRQPRPARIILAGALAGAAARIAARAAAPLGASAVSSTSALVIIVVVATAPDATASRGGRRREQRRPRGGVGRARRRVRLVRQSLRQVSERRHGVHVTALEAQRAQAARQLIRDATDGAA
jgi:hypothetical protein